MSVIPPGWPCAALSATPPSVLDAEAQPTADTLLPQILPLTPRGPAWGTDEAGDGRGASPVQRRVWRAIAAWAADHLGLDWTAATQSFPSAITYTLPDWERELGLPDACAVGPSTTDGRISAVRAKFAAAGGCSPAYFVCLARSLGYAIRIEEPTQFMVDVSECSADSIMETWFTIDEGEVGDDGDPLEGFALPQAPDDGADQVGLGFVDGYFRVDEGRLDDTPLESDEVDPAATVWKYWIVHVASLSETWFHIDEGVIDYDPLEGFVPAADLECLIRALAPEHTIPVFAYDLAA